MQALLSLLFCSPVPAVIFLINVLPLLPACLLLRLGPPSSLSVRHTEANSSIQRPQFHKILPQGPTVWFWCLMLLNAKMVIQCHCVSYGWNSNNNKKKKDSSHCLWVPLGTHLLLILARAPNAAGILTHQWADQRSCASGGLALL